jgi:hypothetical protein
VRGGYGGACMPDALSQLWKSWNTAQALSSRGCVGIVRTARCSRTHRGCIDTEERECSLKADVPASTCVVVAGSSVSFSRRSSKLKSLQEVSSGTAQEGREHDFPGAGLRNIFHGERINRKRQTQHRHRSTWKRKRHGTRVRRGDRDRKEGLHLSIFIGSYTSM